MAESRDNRSRGPKNEAAPGWPVEPAKPAASPSAERPSSDRGAGRIVHDERGNAVWNWVKETGRSCIDSTSALLKRLEISDLKIEGSKDEPAGPQVGARDSGGGYDPYNQKTPVKKTGAPAKPTLNKPYVRPLNKLSDKK